MTTPVVINEASSSEGVPQLKTSEQNPRTTLITSLSSEIHATAVKYLSARPTTYPSYEPVLSRDCTYTGDASQPARKYICEVGGPNKRGTAILDHHEVPLAVPQYLEPLQTAFDIVNGVKVQTTATRTSGPSDFSGIAVPIVAQLSDALQRSYTWDFIWPFARTLANLATTQAGLDSIGVTPDWGAGAITAPAAAAYSYCTITYAELGSYTNGTLATANCAAYSFKEDVLLVPLPRWSTSLAQVGYAAWSSHTYHLFRNNGGQLAYFTGCFVTQYPAPMHVVFVVDDAPAGSRYSTGNPVGPNATQLPVTAPDYEAYLRFLRASVGDDEQLIRAAVLVSSSCRTEFFDTFNGVPTDLDVLYTYHINQPNPLAFCLLHCSVVPRPSRYFDCLPAGCWVAPIAMRIWFAIELVGLKNRVSPYALLYRPSDAPPQQFVKHAIAGQQFISDMLSHFGYWFDPEETTPLVDTHNFVPIVSPNRWFESQGVAVTTPHGKLTWNAPRSGIAQPFSLSSNRFDDSLLWITAYSFANGVPIVNLDFSGPAAAVKVYPLPCDGNGVFSAGEVAQLRPVWPNVGWCNANPTGIETNTTYYTQTLANVALFESTGSVLPGLRVSGSEEGVNLWSDSFLGQPEL